MWGYLSAAIGFLGFAVAVLTVILYLRGRSERRPCWAFETHSVIGRGAEVAEDIQILFREHTVSQVSVTRLLFWNRGRESIRKTDVVGEVTAAFPEEVDILREPRVVKSSRKEIGFCAKRKDHSVTLAFEFLDHGDGAVIEVVHTGDTGTKPELSGTIIEVPKGVKFMGLMPLPLSAALVAEFRSAIPGRLVSRTTLGDALIVLAITVVVGAVFGIPLGIFMEHFGSWWYVLVLAFGGFLFLAFFMVTIILFLEMLRSKLPPWFYSGIS